VLSNIVATVVISFVAAVVLFGIAWAYAQPQTLRKFLAMGAIIPLIVALSFSIPGPHVADDPLTLWFASTSTFMLVLAAYSFAAYRKMRHTHEPEREV
jgi:hypothetical protein